MKYILFVILATFSQPSHVVNKVMISVVTIPLTSPLEGSVKPVERVYKVGNTVVTPYEYRRVSTTLVAPVITDDPDTWTEHECLSRNIYWESKGEGIKGMALTAQITMNRVNSNKRYFPNTVCQVVRQKLRRGCSFSWFCDGRSDKPKELARFEEAKEIATKALQGDYNSLTSVKYYKRCDTESSFFNKLSFKFRYKNHCYFGEV